MNFVADEGVDRQIVERLRNDGYPVVYIAELAPSISNDAVLDLAKDQGALLLTAFSVIRPRAIRIRARA